MSFLVLWQRSPHVNYPALLAPSRLAAVSHSLRTGILPQRQCAPGPLHGRRPGFLLPSSFRRWAFVRPISDRDEDCPAGLIPGVLALYPNIGNGSRTRSRSSFPSIGCDGEAVTPREPVYSWLLPTNTFGWLAVTGRRGIESLRLLVSADAEGHVALLSSLLRAPLPPPSRSVPTSVGTSALVEEGGSALDRLAERRDREPGTDGYDVRIV